MTGHVYILSNPAFASGIVKIGSTKSDPSFRAANLSSATGVPTSFVVEYSVRVEDEEELEKAVHLALDRFRVDSRREYFSCGLQRAKETINQKATGRPNLPSGSDTNVESQESSHSFSVNYNAFDSAFEDSSPNCTTPGGVTVSISDAVSLIENPGVRELFITLAEMSGYLKFFQGLPYTGLRLGHNKKRFWLQAQKRSVQVVQAGRFEDDVQFWELEVEADEVRLKRNESELSVSISQDKALARLPDYLGTRLWGIRFHG